jgi:hypothetical protein
LVQLEKSEKIIDNFSEGLKTCLDRTFSLSHSFSLLSLSISFCLSPLLSLSPSLSLLLYPSSLSPLSPSPSSISLYLSLSLSVIFLFRNLHIKSAYRICSSKTQADLHDAARRRAAQIDRGFYCSSNLHSNAVDANVDFG